MGSRNRILRVIPNRCTKSRFSRQSQASHSSAAALLAAPDGTAQFSWEVTESLTRRQQFSPREQEVLAGMGRGLSN